MITRRDAVFFLFLALCSIIFFAPVLFTGTSYFLRDITFIFHPWRALSAEMVMRGEMPLWDPYAYCGMPFLANWQSAVLYPFTLFFYIFPFVKALKIYHALHLFLTGFFAYLFARRTGLPRHAAACVMLVAAMNGYLVTRVEFLSHFGADAWFFCLLLAAHSPLFLGGAYSLCLLAGHPVSLLQAFVIFLYSLFFAEGHPPARRYGATAAGFLLAAGITAAQIYPTFELAALAGRVKDGIDAAVAMTYSLRIQDIAGIISPYIIPPSSFAISGEKFFWGTACWIGICASVCALAGIIFPVRRKALFFWTAAFCAAVVLSLGNSTMVYPWLYQHVPLFRFMRYPSQFMLIAVNALAILAGAGLARLRPRYGMLAVACIAGELLITGGGFQITAPEAYFHEKPALARSLQSAEYPNRFLLSPGTEKNMRMHGATIPDAWQAARGYLHSLVCLPYHVENAYGTGEPLAPAHIDSAVDDAYRRSSVSDSLPYIKRLGVTRMITRSSAGYEDLPSEHAEEPFMYRVPGASRFIATIPGVSITDAIAGFSSTAFTARSEQPFFLEWKETYFPGWQVYIDGKRSAYAPADTPFRVIALEKGGHKIIQVYRPVPWRTGLAFSLFTIIICMIFGIIKLRRTLDAGHGTQD